MRLGTGYRIHEGRLYRVTRIRKGQRKAKAAPAPKKVTLLPDEIRLAPPIEDVQ